MPTDLKNTQFPKTITVLLASLPQRQRDVIHKRFGLKNGRRMTLEEIGEEYGITRERVRQIERDAKAAVLKSEHFSQLQPHFDHLDGHFQRHGGLRAEHKLFEEDAKELFHAELDAEIARAYLHFLLSIHELFVKHPETDAFHSVWSLKHVNPEPAKKAVQDLVARLEGHNQPIQKDTLLQWFSELSGEKREEVLESYITLSKLIGANVYGEYGLVHWPEIATRGVRDKAYVVLKKKEKPMHFREIVDHINKAFQHGKQAHPQTVHNELIKNERFVLVGRGTYALSEWGYRPGKVADVLVRIFKDGGRPLSKDEVIEAVLKERNVKPNTILLNLQNKAYFEKMGDGRFALKGSL